MTKPEFPLSRRVPLSQPTRTGGELELIGQVYESAGARRGYFGTRCAAWIEQELGEERRCAMTTSGTQSLEMAALLLDLRPGDEVIAPSYTFASTANAFAMRGASLVFVDIRPDTLNLDERLLEGAITPRTRAVVPVHYAGVGCEMDAIMSIANQHGLAVIEDAAQALRAKYRGKALGTFGELAIFSFHQTKNYTAAGEGGALVTSRPDWYERVEVFLAKGTDSARFFAGKASFFTWTDLGSSYAMNEMNAAYLYANLAAATEIDIKRQQIWDQYYSSLQVLHLAKKAELPQIPEHCQHNAHLFYIKLKDKSQRNDCQAFLNTKGISAGPHYNSLHTSPAGRRFGRLHGEDRWSTRESERLLRLPLFYNMKPDDVSYVIDSLLMYFNLE
jgi:dTDP-4-amino-4,6-dideoxygalactose transaminase